MQTVRDCIGFFNHLQPYSLILSVDTSKLLIYMREHTPHLGPAFSLPKQTYSVVSSISALGIRSRKHHLQHLYHDSVTSLLTPPSALYLSSSLIPKCSSPGRYVPSNASASRSEPRKMVPPPNNPKTRWQTRTKAWYLQTNIPQIRSGWVIRKKMFKNGLGARSKGFEKVSDRRNFATLDFV